MKIISALLLTISIGSVASECDMSSNSISAYYQLTTQTAHAKESQPQLFELHRDNHSVLQRNISQGIHDVWTKTGHRMSLSRAFDQYQHAIEYQSNELRYQPKWRDITQLVTTPELKEMTLAAEKNASCQLEQHYVMAINNVEYQLVWLPNLRLVKYFQRKNAQASQTWTMTKYQSKPDVIASHFAQYADYQSTDYADIGDNESIPFLAAMINQGFSVQATRSSVDSHSRQHEHQHE
ncbi:MAG: hypothetical protein ACPG52_12095 [Cognaticolwellia sp.]